MVGTVWFSRFGLQLFGIVFSSEFGSSWYCMTQSAWLWFVLYGPVSLVLVGVVWFNEFGSVWYCMQQSVWF